MLLVNWLVATVIPFTILWASSSLGSNRASLVELPSSVPAVDVACEDDVDSDRDGDGVRKPCCDVHSLGRLPLKANVLQNPLKSITISFKLDKPGNEEKKRHIVAN